MLGKGYQRVVLTTLMLLSGLIVLPGARAVPASESVVVGGQTPPPFTLSTSLSPRALSPTEPTPVALGLKSEFVGTNEFPHPEALSEIKLMLDRHLRISTWGLPTCDPRLQFELGVSVRGRCGPALVGDGEIETFFAFPESNGLLLRAKAFLYNGGTRAGKTRLWFYVPINTRLQAYGVIIARIELRRISAGRYGTEAIISMPNLADGHGRTELLSLNINRKYEFKGKARSAATLGCADGKFQAEGQATFLDGTVTTAETLRTCASALGR